MKTTTRFAALTLSLTLGTGIVTLPLAARASEEGKRNTALALGATAAALLLTQKNKLPGIVAAGAAAVAVTQLGHDRRDRYRHDDGYGYNDNRRHDDYGYGHNNGYDSRGHDDYHNGGYRYGQNDANRRDDYRDSSNYRNSADYRDNSSNSGYRVGQNSPNRYDDNSRAAQSRTVRGFGGTR